MLHSQQCSVHRLLHWQQCSVHRSHKMLHWQQCSVHRHTQNVTLTAMFCSQAHTKCYIDSNVLFTGSHNNFTLTAMFCSLPHSNKDKILCPLNFSPFSGMNYNMLFHQHQPAQATPPPMQCRLIGWSHYIVMFPQLEIYYKSQKTHDNPGTSLNLTALFC